MDQSPLNKKSKTPIENLFLTNLALPSGRAAGSNTLSLSIWTRVFLSLAPQFGVELSCQIFR